MTAKQLALKDMVSCGISINFVTQEREILDYISYCKSESYDENNHPDFRAFNKKSIKELY